jgi:FlgD Ig-like domain
VPDLDGNHVPNEATDRDIARAAFEAAFARWDAVTPSQLNFNEVASNVPAGGLVQDGWNTISFGDLGPDGFGVTDTYREVSTGRILESDIVLNRNTHAMANGDHRLWVVKAHGAVLDRDRDYMPFYNFPGPEDVDYNGNGFQEWECDAGKTATHEIGHFLGLVHNVPLGGSSNDFNNPLMEQYTSGSIGPHLGGWTNIVLKNSDMDGENFLYCPDLGDAPDPCVAGGLKGMYPSLVHDPMHGRTLNGETLDKRLTGADHFFGIKPLQARNWTYEWLAILPTGDVTSECEANITNRDPNDDGVTWYPNPPIWGRTMKVKEWIRTSRDNVGNAHDYFNRSLYANAWLDVNQDCIWQEGNEHFMDYAVFPGAPPPFGSSLTTVASGIQLPLVVDPTRPVWLRCRLDWDEDAGAASKIDSTLNKTKGAAQFGEVEDYPFYCTTRYEQMWFCYPFPLTFPHFSMVVIGPPDPSDQTFSAVVDGSDCVQTITPPPLITYSPTADETVGDFPLPTISLLPIYYHFGWCRPNYPPLSPPYTTARVHLATESVPAGAPAELVPPNLRIPTVNCEVWPSKLDIGGLKVDFTVGAVDLANGGWIDGPDSLTGQWTDSLRVTVAYRVSPDVVPLASLSPCDPAYTALALHPVGTGVVTPEDGFNFELSIPGDVPDGSRVILEVDSRWSENSIVNHQIVEFPQAITGPTAAGGTPPPTALALDNFPNPFNPTTTIRYALPKPARVSLSVYDVAGRLVRTLVPGTLHPAGVFDVKWDGTDEAGRTVASGVYFYRLRAGAETLTRKAVLLK